MRISQLSRQRAAVVAAPGRGPDRPTALKFMAVRGRIEGICFVRPNGAGQRRPACHAMHCLVLHYGLQKRPVCIAKCDKGARDGVLSMKVRHSLGWLIHLHYMQPNVQAELDLCVYSMTLSSGL